MSGSKTATVETLTAEVRVLMVGSRQITLSVYAQLDSVDFDEIEPFGRVRPRDSRLDYIYLVGRHRQTNVLVRSIVPGGVQSIKEDLCWGEYSYAILAAETKARDLTRELERAERYELDCHHLGDSHRCLADEITAKQAELQAARDTAAKLRGEYAQEEKPALAQAAKLAELPLIILAGLR